MTPCVVRRAQRGIDEVTKVDLRQRGCMRRVRQLFRDHVTAGHVFAAAVAVLLMLAAGAKAYTSWVLGPLTGNALGTHLLIALEVALAGWLVSNHKRRQALLVTGATFACFAFVATMRLDRASCGCFGAIIVPPVVTLIVDVAVAGAAFVLATAVRPVAVRGAAGVAACGVVAVLAFGGFSQAGQAPVDTGWLDRVETDENLSVGSWEVVVVRHSCDSCIAYLGSLLEVEPGSPPRLLVEMEPYSEFPSALMLRAKAQAVWTPANLERCANRRGAVHGYRGLWANHLAVRVGVRQRLTDESVISK